MFPLKWSQHVNQRLHFFLSSNDEPFYAKHTLLHIKHVFRLWNICKHIICKCVCGTALFKKYFSIWKCTETAKEVEKIVCISRKRKFMANRFERTHLNSKCILYFPKTLFFRSYRFKRCWKIRWFSINRAKKRINKKCKIKLCQVHKRVFLQDMRFYRTFIM